MDEDFMRLMQRKTIFVFSRSCPHCEEVMNTELFKNISSAIDIAFGDSGFLYGADYSRVSELIDRRPSLSTPSVVINPIHDDPFIFDNRLGSYAYVYKYLGLQLKGRKRKTEKTESGSSESRARKGRRKRFVEEKQMKREVIEAMKGCEEDVCREI